MGRAFADLQQTLDQSLEWYTHVVEYGLSHSLLRLVLHRNTFPRGTEILLGGCERFEGDFIGGPYALTLSERSFDVRAPLWRLSSNCGGFVILFSRIETIGDRL